MRHQKRLKRPQMRQLKRHKKWQMRHNKPQMWHKKLQMRHLQSLELEEALQKSSKVDFEKQVNPRKLFLNVLRNSEVTKLKE